jgi:hypothetical protein
MPDSAKLREQAAKCRRLASMRRNRPPSPYLLSLAEHFDRQAASLEMAHAGNKPPGERPENRPAASDRPDNRNENRTETARETKE